MKDEIILKGLPIVTGRGYGKALIAGKPLGSAKKKKISEKEIGRQIMLFNEIRGKAKEYYQTVYSQLSEMESPVYDSSILSIYETILEDPSFVGQVIELVSTQLFDLETAIRLVSNEIVKRFNAAKTEYLSERSSDIIEICEKLILLIDEGNEKYRFEEPVIIIAFRTLIPSDILPYDKSMIKGIVSLSAGRTSHAAIIARAYNIPVVSGIKLNRRYIKQDIPVCLDGKEGILYLNPTALRISAFKKDNAFDQKIETLRLKWDRHVKTKDNVEIQVLANVSMPDDVNEALKYGADGIGLVRSEYLLYLYKKFPSQKEQEQYYRNLFDRADGVHLVIRLMDIGADKIPQYFEMPHEINPFMGWRGIRILLKQKELFDDQVTAIMNAAEGRDYSIMVPMVSTFSEWKQAKNFILSMAKKLKTDLPKCGMLFEVPLALLEIDKIIKDVDFASIGTNDLIQYLNAADRDNPMVNYLNNPVEPAFLRILKNAIHVANKANKTISVCGEMAGLPIYTILLIGLGLKRFSIAPRNIPFVKEIISMISMSETSKHIKKMMSLDSSEEMIVLLKQLNKTCLGDLNSDIEHFYIAM